MRDTLKRRDCVISNDMSAKMFCRTFLLSTMYRKLQWLSSQFSSATLDLPRTDSDITTVSIILLLHKVRCKIFSKLRIFCITRDSKDFVGDFVKWPILEKEQFRKAEWVIRNPSLVCLAVFFREACAFSYGCKSLEGKSACTGSSNVLPFI